MRSRSSTISSVSSCSTTKSVEPISNNPMAAIEKEVVSEFVLKIFQKCFIQQGGLIEKRLVWTEFKHFDKAQEHKDYFANKNIGTLLRQNGFLRHTERGSLLYCIRMRNLFEYRNAKLREIDENQINGKTSSLDSMSLADFGDKAGVIQENFEIAPDAEEFPVVFKRGFEQVVDQNFSTTVSGCYICQKNFTIQSDFEDHVEYHGIESDFEFLSSPGKSCVNIFEIIYRLVNNSHNFYFTMRTNVRDIILEKIVLIKPNMMHYIKTNDLPYEIPSDGIDSFLIDSHLFTIGAEQPIVLVYRNKSDKTKRFVEQHHFLRTEEFPQVHFNTRSCRIPMSSVLKTKFKLPEYNDELNAMKALLKKGQFSPETLSSLSSSFREFISNKKLNELNSYDVLKKLNQIEDLCSQEGYSQLRQEGAQIKRFGRDYSVKVKKLPKEIILENILSPLDEIYLTEEINPNMQARSVNKHERGRKKPKVYRAVVERVYYDTVCFKYDGAPICDQKSYNVSFKPSRLGLRYQYRALKTLQSSVAIKKYLFPLTINFQNTASSRDFELFNPSIKTNAEQLQAVRNIVDGPSSFAPYIIFGPPGTGKTSTIVEAVLQLWKQRPDTRILITAGSNAACDEVAVRLCRVLTDLQPGEPNILRIFARSNEKRLDSIDDLLLECSNFYRCHFYPSVEVIQDFRIIACTLSVVGKLVTGGIGNNFFTHVFIDECAASTEPESLIGIAGTFSMKTRLILAGDHKQLGPVLKSSLANDMGLKISLMERLLSLDCYSVGSNGDYDRSIQSRLVQNFRSHSKIVDLFNTLYYGGNLKSMVNDNEVDLVSKWYRMPNKAYPIVFHAVYGSNRQGGRSLSLSNEREVEVVIDYVKDLMYFGMNGEEITETDIGIISPYKKQYTRIQEELNRRRWFQIEVGAVETFQGKEKRIIIVSNVRSFTKTLGFLDNPRRLNVILSRAQCMLIMIGNPTTLSQNEDFKYIISECRRNNSVIGSFRDIEMQEKGETKDEENTSTNVLNNAASKKKDSRSLITKKKTQRKITKKCKDQIIIQNNKSSASKRIANDLRKATEDTNDISIAVRKVQNTTRNLTIKDKVAVNTSHQNQSVKALTQKNIEKLIDASQDYDLVTFQRKIEEINKLRESQPIKREPVKTNIQRNFEPDEDLLEIQKTLTQLCQPTRVEPRNNNVTSYAVRPADSGTFASTASSSNYSFTPRNNNSSAFTVSQPTKVEPRSNNVTNYTVRSANSGQFASSSSSSNYSSTPRNNNSSGFTFIDSVDIHKYEKSKYEKIAPLTSRRPKESKCVLC